MISKRRRDHYAGALMALIGASAAYIGSTYDVGTPTRMGPGFFPTCLGVMLILVGFLIAAAAKSGSDEAHEATNALNAVSGTPDWRGWLCIAGSVGAFIVLAEYAGLMPATFFCVFIAALGDRTATVKTSAALAAAITIFGVALFSYVLQVQIPIIRGL